MFTISFSNEFFYNKVDQCQLKKSKAAGNGESRVRSIRPKPPLSAKVELHMLRATNQRGNRHDEMDQRSRI
jgi:hypothetical protein